MTNKRKWKRFRNGQKKDAKNKKKKMHERLYNPGIVMMIILSNSLMTRYIKMQDCKMPQLLKDFKEYKRRVKDAFSIE